MSNVTKFLLLAFSLMMTCILVVYFNKVAKAGIDTSNTAMHQLSKFNQELAESDITMYDGLEVRGSDVVNFIKKQLGAYDPAEEAMLYIHVVTATYDCFYRNNAFISKMQDFSSERYIKPTATFCCNIIRDANHVIIGINFLQG